MERAGSREGLLMRFLRAALFAPLLLAASAPPASAVTISVIQGRARSTAWDGVGNSAETSVVVGSPPFASGPVTAADGATVATTSVTVTNSYLQLDFTHSRTAAGGSAISDDDAFPSFLFSVSAPIYVTVSGFYTVTDTGAGDSVTFVAHIENNFTHEVLHQTNLWSRFTPNESFVVGQLGGDTNNSVTGATTHLLSPGVPYYLNWYAGIQDLRADAGDTGATAVGQIRFDFVPEPSSALLLGGGLAWLGAARGRRSAAPYSARRA
jgi:hypothetical protein